MNKNFLNINSINLGKRNGVDSVVSKNNVRKKDIAIIGIAGKIDSSDNMGEFWKRLLNKKEDYYLCDKQRQDDYIAFLEANGMKTETEKITFKKSGYLKDVDKFDYDFFGINPQEAEYMDPSQRMTLQTVYNALEDAGYGEKNINGKKIGVYIGHTPEARTYSDLFKDSPELDYGKALVGNMPSVIASRLSYVMNLKGPTMLIDTSCSSGLLALHVAIDSLRNGDCEMAVAGAISYAFEPQIKNDVNVGIISSDGRAKAFDDYSDGTGLGEASVAIIIKQLYKAIEDNDSIYAVIKGGAFNQDGSSVGITAPNMSAQEKMIEAAWKDADIDPSTISYIETHGTGTNLGDPIEINAIKNAFEKYTSKKQFCAVASVKTNVGHTNAAAGMVGLIKAVLAIKNKTIPASLNFNVPNRNINFVDSPVYVNTETVKWDEAVRRCGVSSFGLSGTNAHIILEEYKAEYKDRSLNDNNKLLTVSAKSLISLKELLKRYYDYLSANDVQLDDFCYTINSSRKVCEYRCAFIFTDRNELIKQLFDALNDIESSFVKVTILSESSNSVEIIKKYNDEARKDCDALKKLSKLFMSGYDINWELFYEGCNPLKINAPSYVFEKKRCWYDAKKNPIFIRRFEKYCNALLESNDTSENLKNALREFNEEYQKYIKTKESFAVKDEVIITGRENGKYTDAERFIAQMCYETFGYKEIDINKTLDDMNADSLQIVTYYGKIRNEYEVNVTDIYTHPTVAGLAEYISKKQVDIEAFVEKFEIRLSNLIRKNAEYVASDDFKAENEKYIKRCEEENSLDLSIKNNYKKILVTGATGYLGIHLLKELLECCDAELYTIEREVQGSCVSRIEKNFETFFGKDSFKSYRNRVTSVFGNLDVDKFGMDEAEYQKLANNIDCIVHSAANTNHFGEYESFYKSNVVASEEVIRFAEYGQKKDIHYVSTMNVIEFAPKSNETFFTEYDNVSLNNVETIDNYYARTKIIAEHKMNEARLKGLNVSIYRCGRIMFEYDTGVMQNNIRNNASCLIIKAFLTLGIVPDIPEYTLDFTFVDTTAKGMAAIICAKELNNSTFHMTNPYLTSFSDILSNENTIGHGRKVSIDEFLAECVKSFESNDDKKDYFRDILIHAFNDGNAESSMDYCTYEATDRTKNAMKRLGVEWKQVTPEVFNRFILHCKEKNFLD